MSDEKSLDIEPWIVCFNGVPGPRSAVYKPRFQNGFGEVVMRKFVPRREFSQSREDYRA